MSDIEVLAVQLAHGISISELHGAVSGLVARHFNQLDDALDRGFQLLDGNIDPEYLDPFTAMLAESMLDPNMGFAPMLDDLSGSLANRIDDLSKWITAFISGYYYRVDESVQKTASSEVEEILADFQAISQIDSTEQDSDEGEAEFIHVYEYVRVGAILLMESASDNNS